MDAFTTFLIILGVLIPVIGLTLIVLFAIVGMAFLNEEDPYFDEYPSERD